MVNKEEITKRNVSTILKDILQFKKIQGEDWKNVGQLYFRGESKKYQYRIPSLYRKKELVNKGSEKYYRYLVSELGRDDYNENSSLFSLLSELQHYGACTRMIDVTKSPLIALFFAVEKDDKEPGYIYIYSSKNEEKFDTGHTVAVKSALNFMPQKIINNFLDTCKKLNKEEYKDLTISEIEDKLKKEYKNLTISEIEDKLKEEYKDLTTSELEDKLKEEVYKDLITSKIEDKLKEELKNIKIFMEVLNQRARVRERLEYPLKIYNDLSEAHIIIPSKKTDRIRQQQGAFILPRYTSTSEKEHEEIQEEIGISIDALLQDIKTRKNNNSGFSVIKINAGDKKHILEELEQLGITEGFVYPDIEHQSNALIRKYN